MLKSYSHLGAWNSHIDYVCLFGCSGGLLAQLAVRKGVEGSWSTTVAQKFEVSVKSNLVVIKKP